MPALFHFLVWLHKERNEDVRFSLQFRSFGSDLPVIATEFNAFCKGLHPLFPGFALGDRHIIDLADPEGFGTFFRDGSGR